MRLISSSDNLRLLLSMKFKRMSSKLRRTMRNFWLTIKRLKLIKLKLKIKRESVMDACSWQSFSGQQHGLTTCSTFTISEIPSFKRERNQGALTFHAHKNVMDHVLRKNVTIPLVKIFAKDHALRNVEVDHAQKPVEDLARISVWVNHALRFAMVHA